MDDDRINGKLWQHCSTQKTKSGIILWETAELKAIVLHLLRQTSATILLCMDGLDELDDKFNSSDMHSFINEVKKLPHTKVLVSCRPKLDVLSQLATKPNMRLQDLTSEDISDTVTKTLRTEFAKIGQVSSKIVESIASTVTFKAQGVFLWVVYVLQNVCTGIRSMDDIGDLQRRVDELPIDMMDLYRAMIQRGLKDHGIHANLTYGLLGYIDEMPMPLFQLAVLGDLELQKYYSRTNTPFDRSLLKKRYESFKTKLPLLSARLLEASTVWDYTYFNKSTGHSLKCFGTYIARPFTDQSLISSRCIHQSLHWWVRNECHLQMNIIVIFWYR